ncbi:ribonuclease H family protein, partial [Morganella morganii]|uniref:ribonuclease H family protein n=1 Tax=Morganella morganii TaxID=582 RepID=UPI003D7CFE44
MFLAPPLAGCRGVIRDITGRWKGAYVYNIGTCSPLQAEAWALSRGIQLTVSIGFKKVILESDSLVIVESLCRESTPSIVAY